MPGSGMDVDYVDVVSEIASITLWGSDSKFQKMLGELESEVEG